MDRDIEKVINRLERIEDFLRREIADLKEDLRVLDRDVIELYELIAWNKTDFFFKEGLEKLREDIDTIKRKVGI